MSTSKMYFNYDNDKQVYVVPVLPEELQVTVKGETSSVQIDKFGEVLHKGKRDGVIIKFESYFPSYFGSFCSCSRSEFKSAAAWHKWMQSLQDADNPCHFVYTNSPAAVNFYADIINYSAKERGGDPGTLYYTVELKESRTPSVRKYTKKVTANATKVTTAAPATRASNPAPSNKYRVTAGVGLNLRMDIWGSINVCMPYGSTVTTDGQVKNGWAHVNWWGIWGWASLDYLQKC